jgi:peptidoglycan hydrolase-like protein with peptidoglycan-binding domain
MRPAPPVTALMTLLLFGGCQASLPAMAPPEQVSTRDQAPPWAAPGTCWATDETPAVIETVTEQVARPRDAGGDGGGVVYETKTRQKIVEPRRDTWFETPCEAQLTEHFTASLQRALKARGHYRGPVTGRLDRRTRAAIRAYQKPQGLDSGMISLAAARQMGLVAVETSDKAGGEALQLRSPASRRAEAPGAPAPDAEAASGGAEPTQDAGGTPAEGVPSTSPDTPDSAGSATRGATAIGADKPTAPPATEADRNAAAAEAERARRAAELAAALSAEAAAKGDARPLPISTETYRAGPGAFDSDQ